MVDVRVADVAVRRGRGDRRIPLEERRDAALERVVERADGGADVLGDEEVVLARVGLDLPLAVRVHERVLGVRLQAGGHLEAQAGEDHLLVGLGRPVEERALERGDEAGLAELALGVRGADVVDARVAGLVEELVREVARHVVLRDRGVRVGQRAHDAERVARVEAGLEADAVLVLVPGREAVLGDGAALGEPRVPGAAGVSPVTAPPGLAIATAQAPSANRSARNTMFRRGLPTSCRLMKRVRDEVPDDARVRARSTFASVPRSIRDKVPPWSTTW